MSSHRKLRDYLNEIEGRLGYEIPEEQKRFYAIKLFERDDKIKDAMKNAPDVLKISLFVQRKRWMTMQRVSSQTRDTVYIGSIIGDCLKKNTNSRN